MNTSLMFSKASDEWSTPQDFYDRLHDEFQFDLDAAASAANRKCERYYGLDNDRDALTLPWVSDSAVWCNPPYSKCREFVGKAAEESWRRGVTSALLVPSRTDTRWFHDYVWSGVTGTPYPGVSIRFVRGRLKFGGAANGAPFPSLVVVFRP